MTAVAHPQHSDVVTSRTAFHHHSIATDVKVSNKLADTQAVAPPSVQLYTPPRTPTSTLSSVHKLLQELQSIHTEILALPSLAPGPRTNVLFTELVNLCTKPYCHAFTSALLSLPGTRSLSLSLRSLCASSEGELERYWANQMLDLLRTSPKIESRDILSVFPYYQNYIDLSRLECSLLEAFLPHASPKNIAFIGSGPLPLTCFCMLDRYPSATAHNIERDASALSISQSLSEELGYGRRMTFECTDAGSESRITPWDSFDVVFLAALVGLETETKVEILRRWARELRPGTLLVARSATGVRSVVYPVLEVSEELQHTGLEILAEVHPWTEVVNSVVVMRVKER